MIICPWLYHHLMAKVIYWSENNQLIHYVTIMSYGFDLLRLFLYRVICKIDNPMMIFWSNLFLFSRYCNSGIVFLNSTQHLSFIIVIGYILDTIAKTFTFQQWRHPVKHTINCNIVQIQIKYNCVAGKESRISSWLYLCFG